MKSTCQFPIAAVKNDDQDDGLQQHTSTLSQFWRSEVSNQYHWAEIKVAAEPHSLISREVSVSCLFF